MPSPPEIKAFLQSGKGVSDTNPTVFEMATNEVNRTFTQLFKENYYLSHPNMSDYYRPHDITRLEQAVASLVNLTNWEYKESYFDCSEMSALTEYALEAAGFETLIVANLDPTGAGDPQVTEGHAWCVVILKSNSGSQLVPIEATAQGGPQIVPKGKKSSYRSKGKTGSQMYDEYVSKGWVLKNIYEAYGYIPGDFDWWNSAQINRAWLK